MVIGDSLSHDASQPVGVGQCEQYTTVGDPADWDAVITVRCRDKPFPAYNDIAFLCESSVATGRFGQSSETVEPSTVVSSSSSSPGDDDTITGVRQLAINLSPGLFEPGSTYTPGNETARPNISSRSPSPPLVQPTVGGSASGSGHSSAGKQPRSPPPSA
uniref:Uncharacterized protein n=1 Tax=Ananas comosus var. bracteatus TaxID=296719 RepID=A0A6V7PQ13_ANACO|nr:unnamed protein product [Ananas comosus var. bracteatus]